MSIINCNRRDCGYQKDGKCEYNSVTPFVASNAGAGCVYFIEARGGNTKAADSRSYDSFISI